MHFRIVLFPQHHGFTNQGFRWPQGWSIHLSVCDAEGHAPEDALSASVFGGKISQDPKNGSSELSLGEECWDVPVLEGLS